MSFLDTLKYDDNGLIPVVVQDEKTQEVLMLAYMNKNSLDQTIKTKKTYSYLMENQSFWIFLALLAKTQATNKKQGTTKPQRGLTKLFSKTYIVTTTCHLA